MEISPRNMKPTITDYHIEMLSVGAADCFIIYYTDSMQQNKLILVDAGNYNDGDKIQSHIRQYYKNPVINLAIVTHPDDDHFGGFVKMLEMLSDGEKDAVRIEKFWLNSPQKHVKVNQIQNNVKLSTLKQRIAQLFDQSDKNLLEQIEALHIPVEEKFAEHVF